jgi:ABC-type transporter Mla MlaB component
MTNCNKAARAEASGGGCWENAMFRLSVVRGTAKGQATARIYGEAVFTHAQEIQSALCEALAGCDHLTIDLGEVAVLDATFRALLCSLHRHSGLLHKKITLQGALPRRDDPLRYPGINGCLFKETPECCRLWDSVASGPGLAGGKPGR